MLKNDLKEPLNKNFLHKSITNITTILLIYSLTFIISYSKQSDTQDIYNTENTNSLNTVNGTKHIRHTDKQNPSKAKNLQLPKINKTLKINKTAKTNKKNISKNIIKIFEQDNYFQNIENYKPFEKGLIKQLPSTQKPNASIGILLGNKTKFAIFGELPIKIALDLSNTDIGLKLGSMLTTSINKHGFFLDGIVSFQGIIQIQQIYLNIGAALIYKDIFNNTPKPLDHKNSYQKFIAKLDILENNSHLTNSITQSDSNKLTVKPFISTTLKTNFTKKTKINVEIGYIMDYGCNILFSIHRN